MQDFKRTFNQKKGVAGLEIPKAIMISVLVLVFTAFLIVLIASKMMDQTDVTKADEMFNTTINEVADNTTDNIGLIIFLGFLVVIVILVSIALFYLSRVGGSGQGGMGA